MKKLSAVNTPPRAIFTTLNFLRTSQMGPLGECLSPSSLSHLVSYNSGLLGPFVSVANTTPEVKRTNAMLNVIKKISSSLITDTQDK